MHEGELLDRTVALSVLAGCRGAALVGVSSGKDSFGSI